MTRIAKVLSIIILFSLTLSTIPVLTVAKTADIKKTVLILHGWPQPVAEENSNNIYLKYFKDNNYEIIAPKLYTRDFELTPEGAKQYINKTLDGKKPDVILGILMGGLIAPMIAQDYPESRMVLVGSSVKLAPDSRGLNRLLTLVKDKNYLQILSLLKFLPEKLFFNIHGLVIPLTGSQENRDGYIDSAKRNISYILDIPITEQIELIKFANTTDNHELLQKLGNKTLIFEGKNDLLKSELDEGSELHKLIKNSILVETDGSHFEVFTEKNFKELDAFLD